MVQVVPAQGVIMMESGMESFVYDAFISYSHRDMDRARWLQKKLETFRIPEDLAEDWPHGKKLHIFRDQTDLAGIELTEALEKELRQSCYLIVICSPSSASSHWVNEEIRYFRSLGRSGKIIPFIVDGEPESDNPELECYPPAFREEGSPNLLGANIKELGKEKAFLRLLAILLDVRFDRLVDREKRRKRRALLIGGGTAAAILTVITVLSVRNFLVSQRNHRLSYDIYIAAMAESFQKGGTLEENVKNVDTDYLMASAREGNTNAILLLASCYQHGWGLKKDAEKAFYWYKKGAEEGDSSCMLSLANCYLEGIGTQKDPDQSFAWCKKAAETGDPISMVTLGYVYEDGDITKADPKQAFLWYKKAAKKGDEDGLQQLARCYRDGIGTDQSWENAFDCIKKLAEKGNTTAMFNLALMYQYGKGTEKNPEEAFIWYSKAAMAGDADGSFMTGWCIENDYGVKDSALYWYKQAEKLGSKEGKEAVQRIEGK